MKSNDVILKFHPEKLMDLFGSRFVTEQGLVKANEIISKTNGSDKVQKFLLSVGYHSLKPTYVGIISTLNTVPYFMFCKGETLCLASLTVIVNWNQTWNDENQILSSDEVTVLIAETIKYCFSIKFIKDNTIFSRFYSDILRIDSEPLKRNPSGNISLKDIPYNIEPSSKDFWREDEFDYGERLD